ncbi:MAG: HU family DNA-binding protein [Marinibacterium sp.]|nr:HU family DNA-binding protein [Marinibacterium sp.]
MLEEVVVRSGIKKKDAKPVVESMLEILGSALADGRELNLQPLGKLRINRTEDHGNYRIVVFKLRQQTGAGEDGEDPLADAAE